MKITLFEHLTGNTFRLRKEITSIDWPRSSLEQNLVDDYAIGAADAMWGQVDGDWKIIDRKHIKDKKIEIYKLKNPKNPSQDYIVSVNNQWKWQAFDFETNMWIDIKPYMGPGKNFPGPLKSK